MPPTGFYGWFDNGWIAEAPADQLPLTLLAPGHEDRRCGRTNVTIHGDIIVDMPELGECP